MAFDAGGTNIRAIIYHNNGVELARAQEHTSELRINGEGIEHDPEELFQAVLSAGRSAIQEAKIAPNQISALGITVQRATFLLWDKKSGRPACNLVSWADVRAGDKAKEMNRSPVWRLLRCLSAIGGRISGNAMLTASGMLNFVTDHVLVRLSWLFDQRPELRKEAETGNLLFGTLDTWLLYKLSNGRLHATDAGNAAATSLYNPFDMKWNKLFCRLFHIPYQILPQVKESADDFGCTSVEHLGAEIPIRAVAGDQMAALFGHSCLKEGEVKISQGSGSFVDINTGNRGKVSRRGLFPLLAWKVQGAPSYMLEGYVATAGTLIDWLGKGIGLSDTPAVLNEYAQRCSESEGVTFVPTASGVRFPYFNPKAKGTIIGLSLATHRCHVARAVLEGIAHRVVDVLEGIEKDTKTRIQSIKVDGGVSNSDVLLQEIADLSGQTVYRSGETDMTARGVAAMAGIGAGIWKKPEEIDMIALSYTAFHPQKRLRPREERRSEWKRTMKALNTIYQ